MKFNKPMVVGEWSLICDIHPNWAVRQAGWRNFTFGLIFIHTKPEEGVRLTHGQNYKGFLASILFWLPFEVNSWNE